MIFRCACNNLHSFCILNMNFRIDTNENRYSLANLDLIDIFGIFIGKIILWIVIKLSTSRIPSRPKAVALFSPIPFNSMIFVVPSIFCLLQNSLSYSHEKQRNPAIKRDFPSSLILLIIRNNKLAVRHILTVHHSHHMFLLLSQVMLLPVLWLCLLHSKY